MPPCSPGQHLTNSLPSGFFHGDTWTSDQCNIRQFSKEDGITCLRNKSVYIYGDSTVKVFYEYFATNYGPTLVHETYKDISRAKSGPTIARDQENNIYMQFVFHGFPRRPSSLINIETNHYIVKELDRLAVDNQTIILISVGTHFTTFPLEMFEKRMMDIKRAVQRLHTRSPGTLVVFKSANTRKHDSLMSYLRNDDWYIWQLDLSMRKVFADYPNIAFIDAWDITVAQNYSPNVHPHKRVLKNMIDNFLSYVCTKP